MARKYTKKEHFAKILKEQKAARKINCTIAESYGFTKKQIKQLVAVKIGRSGFWLRDISRSQKGG